MQNGWKAHGMEGTSTNLIWDLSGQNEKIYCDDGSAKVRNYLEAKQISSQ